MLRYRRIGREYARIVWLAEQSAPAWFHAAGNLWTPTYRSFLKQLWRDCEIWGLFDGLDLKAVVYLDYEAPDAIAIHVSVVAQVDKAEIVRFWASLKRHKYEQGVRHMHGWLLGLNKTLLDIAVAAGFTPTGLVMDYGSYRGHTFRWVEVKG